MPLSSLAKDCDSFSVIDEALSFFPQGFSKIAHLESYDPTSAEDNDFIENTISLLAFKSADDETFKTNSFVPNRNLTFFRNLKLAV